MENEKISLDSSVRDVLRRFSWVALESIGVCYSHGIRWVTGQAGLTETFRKVIDHVTAEEHSTVVGSMFLIWSFAAFLVDRLVRSLLS